MKTRTFLSLKSISQVVGLVVLVGVVSDLNHALAQDACPLPPGAAPPASPRVTAQQVEDGSASLMDIAQTMRDQFRAAVLEFVTLPAYP